MIIENSGLSNSLVTTMVTNIGVTFRMSVTSRFYCQRHVVFCKNKKSLITDSKTLKKTTESLHVNNDKFHTVPCIMHWFLVNTLAPPKNRTKTLYTPPTRFGGLLPPLLLALSDDSAKRQRWKMWQQMFRKL